MSSIKDKISELSPEDRQLLRLKLSDHVSDTQTDGDQDGAGQLTAYVVAEEWNENKIRQRLSDHLPDYMIPSNFINIPELPRLPNGKLDIQGLKAFRQLVQGDQISEFKAPSTDLERKLAGIWQGVLGIESISVHDNFFDIGGDSIASIQVISKARDLGIPIKPVHLFEHQTIGSLAQAISYQESDISSWEFLTPLRKEGNQKPLFCIHSGGGHVFFYNLLAKYLAPDRPIYALQPAGLYEGEELHESIESMTSDYIRAMKSVQGKGPFTVLVYCFSTAVANEMAIQLKKTNEKLHIVVVDTMASPWHAMAWDVLKIRIRSFITRFLKSPVGTVKFFIQERIYLIKPLLAKIRGDEHEKRLEQLKANLRKISVDYKWSEQQAYVSLLLTDKPDQKFQDLIVNSWQKFAKGGVKIFPTKGTHHTLFEENDIQFVSKVVDQCMDEYNNLKI